MKRYLGISFVTFCSCLLVAGLVLAKPTQVNQVSSATADNEVDAVGNVNGAPVASKVAANDTVWIADWNFEGAGCNSTGWSKYDNRIVNDGSNYWVVDNRFDTVGGITGKAAILSRHTLFGRMTGHGNDWDYSIILKYKGASTLSFAYLSDSEPGFDFVTVETDSAGASEARAAAAMAGGDPTAVLSAFRDEVFSTTGPNTADSTVSVPLSDYAVATTQHEAYIRFASDGAASDEDGAYNTTFHAAAIIDNITVAGTMNYTENFEGSLNANVTFANTSSSSPFGEWARLFLHITDNDKCTENTSCAWLPTDPTRIAFFPDMAFGPGSAVVRNWLDDIFVSPWVSLTSTPSARGTRLQFRRFPGNRFSQGPIVQNWSVRAVTKVDNTDTPALGDSFVGITPWGHSGQWNSLTGFNWITSLFDMSTNFSTVATEIQLRFRVSDWQYINDVAPPITLNPGPGPYSDKIQIGRIVLTGPVINEGIDSRTQAQDCFATGAPNGITPGEHFSPLATDRFGTCAFSIGTDLSIGGNGSANLVTGDSIYLDNVVDSRGAGGIASVKWYGAITSGPHVGKGPGIYNVDPATGFFEVQADSARDASGQVVAGGWNVDMPDQYFRGGDAVKYFWAARDAGNGYSSDPLGITYNVGTGKPNVANVAQAEAATGGLFEVNYLPTINWDAGYLAAVAASPHGDVTPTGPQLANSTQKNCILYYQHTNARRRSSDLQRTSFMFTLDESGYRGYYDVFDVQGYGNTNNQLGGRATVAQASGYSLIIEDDGRSALVPNVPDGHDHDSEKINQAGWYDTYLRQALNGFAQTASVWIIGENTAFEKSSNTFFTVDMGLNGIVTDQALSVNPDVTAVANMTWASGSSTTFVGDNFSLNGGCPTIRAYDAANAQSGAVRTHSYKSGATTGLGAIIMNKDASLKYNTVWCGFGWFDMFPQSGTPSTPDVRANLLRKVIGGTAPACVRGLNPTGVPDPETDAPAVTQLLQNVPNPFNPTTKITFDLARTGHVKLQVFNVAGHLVKTLANSKFEKGRNIAVTWNGLDEGGNRVPSGVYFYQLVTDEVTATKKMVMLK